MSTEPKPLELTNVEMHEVLQDKALTLLRQARELINSAAEMSRDFEPAGNAWLAEYDDLNRLSGSKVTKVASDG